LGNRAFRGVASQRGLELGRSGDLVKELKYTYKIQLGNYAFQTGQINSAILMILVILILYQDCQRGTDVPYCLALCPKSFADSLRTCTSFWFFCSLQTRNDLSVFAQVKEIKFVDGVNCSICEGFFPFFVKVTVVIRFKFWDIFLHKQVFGVTIERFKKKGAICFWVYF
jgi:hypothetical protein